MLRPKLRVEIIDTFVLFLSYFYILFVLCWFSLHYVVFSFVSMVVRYLIHLSIHPSLITLFGLR